MAKEIIIAAMSDSHGSHRDVDVPECDILIHAGDITNFNNPHHYDDFFQWFTDQQAANKIFIGGNHDGVLDSEAKWVFLNKFPKLTYLENSMVELEGLKIWGSAVQPKIFDMAFCREHQERIETWERMPSGMDIVVSHCPPYGVLDRNVNGEKVGCSVLMDALTIKPPLMNLFGHIHEAYGVTSKRLGDVDCVFANCSVVNRKRRVVNKPWVFRIKNGIIDVLDR